MNFFLETGMPLQKYLVRVLDESGGKLPQQTVFRLLSWSEATASRTLTEMEEQGHIVRIQFGSEKIVFLPEAAPDTRLEPVMKVPAD